MTNYPKTWSHVTWNFQSPILVMLKKFFIQKTCEKSSNEVFNFFFFSEIRNSCDSIILFWQIRILYSLEKLRSNSTKSNRFGKKCRKWKKWGSTAEISTLWKTSNQKSPEIFWSGTLRLLQSSTFHYKPIIGMMKYFNLTFIFTT